MTCSHCGRSVDDTARFCSHCGTAISERPAAGSHAPRQVEELNLPILYGMAGALVLAVLLPPWEAPPDDPPAFLGLHPFWMPPTPTAVVSRMLLTIETMTFAIGGIYGSWLFRRRP